MPRHQIMYITKVEKTDLARKWALPDRVFFACGACHILAYTAMERFPERNFRAIWIKPRPGYIINHIVAVSGNEAFDYHGTSEWSRFLEHTRRKARRWWPGWDADLIELPADVLVSTSKSRTYEGLWLREPKLFPHDPLPRAHRFIDRLMFARSSVLLTV
jgi:hypothetical protein